METLVSQTPQERLTRLFREAMQGLDVPPAQERLAAVSGFVHRSMAGHGRNYHGVEHVLEVSASMDPVQTLAALFHDVVYVQADGRVPDFQTAELADSVEFRPDGTVLATPGGDRPRQVLQRLFEVQAGEPILLHGGLNEFLSAQLAMRFLAPLLPLHVLLRIVACIEATIPFRATDPAGRTPPESLFARLQHINRDFELGMPVAELETTVHQAVGLACRDVFSFAVEDTAEFLDATWKLLSESNEALRREDHYTFGEYQSGLAAAFHFKGILDPRRVFPRFRGRPDDVTWERWTEAARRNIDLSARYLGIKLSTVSILLALAVLSGGDGPISMFMGHLPQRGRRNQRLEDLLEPPAGPLVALPAVDAEVLRLLEQGRRSDSGFDLKHAPLAAYVYSRLGDAGIDALLPLAAAPMGPREAEGLLQVLPPDLLRDLAGACAAMSDERRGALFQLAAGVAGE